MIVNSNVAQNTVSVMPINRREVVLQICIAIKPRNGELSGWNPQDIIKVSRIIDIVNV